MKASLAVLAGLVAATQAHMEMTNPAPFRSKNNPYTTNIDYSMTSPLDQSGSNFPCKGYLVDYDTPSGRATANYNAGGTYSLSLAGSATHNGGSCQVSLSFDKGSSWKVIQSYIGNCPLQSSWKFTIPNDTPKGDAVLAWSWFNNLGNREMYMNCAHVTIGSGSKNLVRSPSDPISSRPGLFVANVGNGCKTVETFDVEFPHPGPDVVRNSQKTTPPVGNCG